MKKSNSKIKIGKTKKEQTPLSGVSQCLAVVYVVPPRSHQAAAPTLRVDCGEVSLGACRPGYEPSRSFAITEKAPTKAFTWLKAVANQ